MECRRGGENRGFVEIVGRLDLLALDLAIRQNGDGQSRSGRQRHQLERTDGRSFDSGSEHHRGVIGEACDQLRSSSEQFFQTSVCTIEEFADLSDLEVVEATGLGQMIDEEPVTLVGGHTTRRSMGLREVTLLFEHRHLVANGGRRHVDLVGLGDVRRTDGLTRPDVLLHDCSQDRGLAFVQHCNDESTPRPPSAPGDRLVAGQRDVTLDRVIDDGWHVSEWHATTLRPR